MDWTSDKNELAILGWVTMIMMEWNVQTWDQQEIYFPNNNEED